MMGKKYHTKIELLKCTLCGALALGLNGERISSSGCSTWETVRAFEVDEAQILRLLTKRVPNLKRATRKSKPHRLATSNG